MAKVCGHYYLAYLFYASATQYRPFFPSPLIPAGAVAAPATMYRQAFTLTALNRDSRQHQHQSLPEHMLILVVFCQLPQTPTMHERNKHCMHGTAPATTNNTGVVRQCLARSKVSFSWREARQKGTNRYPPQRAYLAPRGTHNLRTPLPSPRGLTMALAPSTCDASVYHKTLPVRWRPAAPSSPWRHFRRSACLPPGGRSALTS